MLSTNQRLGPYQIQSPIGSGGMGEVYRARDSRLGRDVAVKVLPKEFANNKERMQRFEQEARAASALNHPAIITIYDVGFADSNAYIAMEYVSGKSLAEILETEKLPLKKIITIASQFADALAKAHEAGIVHRDLKPANLMITSDGFLKILDFGLAKLSNPDTQVSILQTQTSAGVVLGTAGYMSPEQASGKPVTFTSDQFSFGTILYEMVTGKRAFEKDTAVETMTSIIRSEPEPISGINPSIPPQIRWIIERCMAKNPGERYASTRDLARDLQSLRDHFGEISTSSEKSQSIQSERSRQRYIIPLLLLAFLAAGSSAFLWFRNTTPYKPAIFRSLTYSGADFSPTVSSNGRLVAFRSDRDGIQRIWLKQLKGGNEVALTSGPDDLPRFSPDGSLLLFIRSEVAASSLYRIPVLGGQERKVIEDVRSADWSPDGNQIVFIRWKPKEGNFDSHFFVVNPDGSNLQELIVVKDRQLHSARWSPDGRYVVATVIIQGNYGSRDAIGLIDIENKKMKWILSAYNSPTSAVWTGTKNKIAYFTPETGVALFQLRGDSTLFVHDVETGKREAVFWAQSAGEIMDIADKNSIIMHSASLRENLREVSLATKHDAPTSSWLTRGNSCNRQPVYSPDGKRILFSSNMAANLDLWDLTTDSRALRRITEDTSEDWDPSYSPDGNYILWSSNRSGHFEIWMANTDGSGARQITKDGVDAENPGMTSDGKWVIYNSYNPDLNVRGIWKIHPDGSGAERIVKGLTQWPEISPDGRYASYSLYKQSLNDRYTYQRVVEINNSSAIPFEIKVSNRDRVGGRMRWMPDGKSIVFVDEDQNGKWGLFAQNFVPGQDTSASRVPIAGFDTDRKIDTFTISPNGSSIVLAEVEVLSSLILAQGIPGILPPFQKE